MKLVLVHIGLVGKGTARLYMVPVHGTLRNTCEVNSYLLSVKHALKVEDLNSLAPPLGK